MEDKRVILVRRLHEKTKAREIDWVQTEAEEMFQAAFPSFSVRISARFNIEYEAYDYRLLIYNREGTLIETFDDTELPGDVEPTPYLMLRETYEGARRHAMGVDKALDDLLRELGEPL